MEAYLKWRAEHGDEIEQEARARLLGGDDEEEGEDEDEDYGDDDDADYDEENDDDEEDKWVRIEVNHRLYAKMNVKYYNLFSISMW